jgi:hypothetical protein
LIGNYVINVKRIISILSVAIVAAVPFLVVSSAKAASATLYLSPSSGTVAIGDTFSVDVYEDSGSQDVNAVQADLTYNQSVLQYISVTSSSAFSISAATSGGGGSVHIDRGAIPAVTGAQLVATVTFKGIAGGTSNINFAGSSRVLANSGPQANQDILSGTSGATYTVPSPPAPPTPPPAPSPTPTPSPSPSPTPSPSPSTKPKTPSPAPKPNPAPTPPAPPATASSKDTTPPSISNIEVTNIGTNSALISWETSEPATSQVDYGITTNYELTNGNGLYVTVHKLSLSYKLLNPDTTFHFTVKSVDSSGNAATSPDQTFTTKAGSASLRVKIVDQNNKPLKDAKVTISRVTGKTDKNGQVTLSELAVGSASVKVDYNGKKTIKTVDIDTSPNQSVIITVEKSKNYAPLIIVPTIILLALAGSAFFLGGNSGNSKFPFFGGGSSNEPMVIGGSSAPPPPPTEETPPPQPKPSAKIPANKPSAKASTSAEAFDPAKDPPPPTIVRPTIPPRS